MQITCIHSALSLSGIAMYCKVPVSVPLFILQPLMAQIQLSPTMLLPLLSWRLLSYKSFLVISLLLIPHKKHRVSSVEWLVSGRVSSCSYQAKADSRAWFQSSRCKSKRCQNGIIGNQCIVYTPCLYTPAWQIPPCFGSDIDTWGEKERELMYVFC